MDFGDAAVVDGRVLAAAAERLIHIAGEALPPELAHLAAGPMAVALPPRTEQAYAATWAAFRAWRWGRSPIITAAPASCGRPPTR